MIVNSNTLGPAAAGDGDVGLPPLFPTSPQFGEVLEALEAPPNPPPCEEDTISEDNSFVLVEPDDCALTAHATTQTPPKPPIPELSERILGAVDIDSKTTEHTTDQGRRIKLREVSENSLYSVSNTPKNDNLIVPPLAGEKSLNKGSAPTTETSAKTLIIKKTGMPAMPPSVAPRFNENHIEKIITDHQLGLKGVEKTSPKLKTDGDPRTQATQQNDQSSGISAPPPDENAIPDNLIIHRDRVALAAEPPPTNTPMAARVTISDNHMPTPPPKATEPVMQQLIAAGVEARKTAGTVEIALHPEELGKLTITYTPGEKINLVQVTIDRPETIDLIRRHMDLLAQEFRQHGLGQVNVSISDDRAPRPQYQKSDGPQSVKDAPTPHAITVQMHEGGVDGVDIRL